MRLVTRPDLDGLTCAVLLSHCETIDSVEFVPPELARHFRPLDAIPVGNRFLVFTLFPHAAAGACLLPPATADARIAEIVSTLERNG